MMDTNLTSAFVCSHAAYPHMKQAGGGKIINIGSMMSIFAARVLARVCGEQGRHRAVRALLRDRLGEGQHPGERDPAGLDRHRPDQGRAARGAGAERARARRARRPAAGASRRTSPASRCFSRARRRISSPARRSRSMAGFRCRGDERRSCAANSGQSSSWPWVPAFAVTQRIGVIASASRTRAAASSSGTAAAARSAARSAAAAARGLLLGVPGARAPSGSRR